MVDIELLDSCIEQLQKIRTAVAMEREAPLTPMAIISRVADYYGVSPANVISTSRMRRVTRPRRVAVFLIRKMCNTTYEALGRIFKRDHSTMIFAEKTLAAEMTRDPATAATVARLEADLRRMA